MAEEVGEYRTVAVGLAGNDRSMSRNPIDTFTLTAAGAVCQPH